jgi:hypothetical protein
MKKLIGVIVFMLMVIMTCYPQDYVYMDEVKTKLTINNDTLKINFDRVMVANIVLTDIEGDVVDRFTNYKTKKDLNLVMSSYGSGIYYLIVQWNNYIAMKRIRVKRNINNSETEDSALPKLPWTTYSDQYKLIVR